MVNNFKIPLNEFNNVLLSDRMVPAEGAMLELPDGCRFATIKEVAFRNLHDADFRNALSKKWVWTAQVGLRGAEFNEIHNDGAHTPCKDNLHYEGLPDERKLRLRTGRNRVAAMVVTDLHGRTPTLTFDAIQGAMLLSCIAYIRDGAPVIKRGPYDTDMFKRHMRGGPGRGNSSDI